MKMRKFADEGIVREGKNESIDEETRARAMASVNKDPLGDFIKSRGLDRGPVAAPAYGMTLADRQTPRTKPSIVSAKELNAFKAKYGADKDLTDYRNAEAGGLKRRNKVNPTLGEAKDKNAQDAADAIDPGDIRTRELGKTRGGPSYDIAGKPSNAGPDVEYVPDSLNRRTGATAKMMSDFNNQANKRTGRGYASGGAVSASRRGDGIAQRGKTRGKMC
jgi:hypothetical protein